MKQYVISIYEGLIKIGQKVSENKTVAKYIAEWYIDLGYEARVTEYEVN
jgi:di/tripeptidase